MCYRNLLSLNLSYISLYSANLGMSLLVTAKIMMAGAVAGLVTAIIVVVVVVVVAEMVLKILLREIFSEKTTVNYIGASTIYKNISLVSVRISV